MILVTLQVEKISGIKITSGMYVWRQICIEID